ncbi:inositol monophosphatase 3, partial [Schistosoma bovis]
MLLVSNCSLILKILVRSEEHELPTHRLFDYKESVYHSDFQSSLPNDDLFVPITDLVIWVDPLDGTQEYTDWGWGSYALSSDLQMAVNSRPVHSLKNDLSITYSRSHLNESLIKDLTKLVYPKPVHFIPAGGAGFKAISLIKGDADVYIHPSTTRRWDVCAPQAILESVGGRLTGLHGSPLGFGSKSSS